VIQLREECYLWRTKWNHFTTSRETSISDRVFKSTTLESLIDTSSLSKDLRSLTHCSVCLLLLLTALLFSSDVSRTELNTLLNEVALFSKSLAVRLRVNTFSSNLVTRLLYGFHLMETSPLPLLRHTRGCGRSILTRILRGYQKYVYQKYVYRC
jgi:hypothetical protein